MFCFMIASSLVPCLFQLTNGHAECAGTPVLPNVEHKITDRHPLNLFSWKGCTLEVRGDVTAERSNYCPHSLVLKNHALFEVARCEADKSGSRGPCVMVVGEGEVGKTTVVRSLLNYAVRMGRAPVYVSLDVKHGDLGVPGTIGESQGIS